MNTFKGTAKDDTFLATAKANWSVADSIDGGKGIDRLKIIDAGAIAQADLEPTSATIKNVEILDLISGDNVNVNSTSIDGLTLLNITSKTKTANADNSATASATTDIKVTDTNADATDVANTITVNGGKDVTVVSKNNGAGDTLTAKDAITVGATTAAAGKVSVTSIGGTANGNLQGNITVNGGTEITVNQYAGNAAALLNDTDGGTVTVNGNASTTTVTVNQTAFGVGFTATATQAGIVGYEAGTVTINDANRTSLTDAGTITTVTLKNYDSSTINSGALTTVNLEGTAGTLGITAGNLTTAKVDTLGLNLNGVVRHISTNPNSNNTITVDSDYKTLNVNSSTTASTLTDIITSATAINISGDAALTLTALTLGATAGNEVITVTNTAGVTIGNALATDVTFTGGAGADSIILSASYTKAINMGAGDDIVVYAAAGAGGSLNGGDGNDTLVVSAASAIAGLPEVSGFEVLRAKGGTSAIHNAHTFKALEVGTNTTATTFTNVAAGVGLTVLENNLGNTTVTLANATGTADVFDLTLKSFNTLAAGTVTLAGVETVNINSVDLDTATVNTNTLTLAAADAKSVVVTGNTGVNFGLTALTKVTNFDASAVTAGAVTFTSANTTISELVTIKGGAGDDTLEGTAQANDTIIGGAGIDTLVYTGGADTFTGGAGDDTFKIGTAAALGTKTKYLTITDLTKGDKIDVSAIAATVGAGAGTAATLGAKVALGAAATFDDYLNEAAKADGTAAAGSLLKWFQFEKNTYLVVDNGASTTAFTEGTDGVIKITGLVDLMNSFYTTGADVITIA